MSHYFVDIPTDIAEHSGRVARFESTYFSKALHYSRTSVTTCGRTLGSGESCKNILLECWKLIFYLWKCRCKNVCQVISRCVFGKLIHQSLSSTVKLFPKHIIQRAKGIRNRRTFSAGNLWRGSWLRNLVRWWCRLSAGRFWVDLIHELFSLSLCELLVVWNKPAVGETIRYMCKYIIINARFFKVVLFGINRSSVQ